MTKKIADVLLKSAYQPDVKINVEKKEKQHIAEDATAHFVIKKLLTNNKEAKKDAGVLSNIDV